MFAAYAQKAKDGEVATGSELKKTGGGNEWLANSSFQVSSDAVLNIQGSSIDQKPGASVRKDEADKSNLHLSDVLPLSPGTPQSSPSSSDGCLTPSSEDSESELRQSESNELHIKSEPSLSDKISTIEHERSRSRSVSQERSRSSSRESRRKSLKSPGDGRKDRDRSKRRRDRKKYKHRSRSRSHESRKSSKHRNSKAGTSRSRRRRSTSSSSSSDNCHDQETTKHKHRQDMRQAEIQDTSHQMFYEDKTRDFRNLNVDTLSRPAIAWYHSSRAGLGLPKYVSYKSKSKKHLLKRRYYNKIVKLMEDDLNTLKEKESGDNKKSGQIQGTANDVEEEISALRAKFNQDLAQDPTNVETWRKYVEFQDVVHQFERVYRRGGGATGARVTAERKLSILDKALKENPLCEELLKERCLLAESVLPMDKLTVQLKTWIGTDPGNLVLWESLIMASQGSLSSCKVPMVKGLYQEALTNINGLRRGNSESAKSIEGKLIDLVLHLGLFLRQAGLLELMWSLINVYLEFNLAKLDPTKFHITNTVADNALTELEEAILGSQLPLSTLWLRVEALRAGTHWVPLPADADSEDPQRLVFPEDVNDLIHPINSPHLTFRLVTVTLSLLKVPLLPWRESAAKAAGLHPLPWLLDGPEAVLASLLPFGTLEFKETSALLMDSSQLASGPQYLIARPGQDEYIDFLSQVFCACVDCLPPFQKTYLLVWWLRFYRWLMQLDRLGHCKLPRGRKKKMRTTAKDILRHDSNRSNFLLFREFALIELENGSLEGAMKVLQGTILALPSSKPVPIAEDRAAICTLYRTLVEVHLSQTQSLNTGDAGSSRSCDTDLRADDRRKALCLLVSLGRGTPLKSEKPSGIDIAAALTKFQNISKEALERSAEDELDPFIAPDVCHVAPTFLVEWVACYGWLLYLSHSIWKAAAMFEDILSQLQAFTTSSSDSSNNSPSTSDIFIHLQRETLLEVYISLLRHHCFETRGSFAVLRDVILRGLKEFPGNLTFAAALSDLETSSSGTGLPLWRLSKLFYKFNSAPAYVLLVFVMKYRLKQQESAAHTTKAILNQGGPELPDPNTRNRMSTLLKKLTKHPLMRRCPMLWRLRLQFVAAVSNNDADCSSTFYLALEDCPWVKALYMDIVQVLPTQLAQVQDLLVEKELRLHVTPEELEILRVDT